MLARRARILLLSVLVLAGLGALAFLFATVPASLQAPRVAQIEPVNDATGILPASPITITFSAPMRRDTAQDAVRISPRVNGDFTWLNNETLVFTPRTALPISKTLTVQIDRGARSWLGRALPENTQTRFTTLSYPHVIDSSPALDAQFVYIPDKVTLTFDRAMNPESVRENLVITPTLANPTLWIEQEHVTLGGFFQPRTRYQIRIARDARDDAHNIPLEGDLVWSFTTAAQYPNFSILNRGRVLDFSVSAPVLIPTQYTNVSRLDVALYPITQSEFDANTVAPFETWYAFQPGGEPVQKNSVPANAQLDRYARQDISLEPLPHGTYYLRITTPEGPADAQLVRIR